MSCDVLFQPWVVSAELPRNTHRNTYSFLRTKFPISHQVNLVGEVQAHCQLDEQVDAETITALRDDGLTCGHTDHVLELMTMLRGHFVQSLSLQSAAEG